MSDKTISVSDAFEVTIKMFRECQHNLALTESLNTELECVNGKLKKQNEELEKRIIEIMSYIPKVGEAPYSKLKKQNEILRAAAKYYSRKANYWFSKTFYTYNILEDDGKTARQALAQCEEIEGGE